MGLSKAFITVVATGAGLVLGEQALMHQDVLAGALALCLLIGITLLLLVGNDA